MTDLRLKRSHAEPAEPIFGEHPKKYPICPSLLHLRAWEVGALPDALKATVDEHVASCRICQTLLQDLQELEAELPRLTPEEDSRIRARLLKARQQT